MIQKSILALTALCLVMPVSGQAAEEDPVETCVELITAFETPPSRGRAAMQIRSKHHQLTEWADKYADLPLIQYSAGLACFLSEDPIAAIEYLSKAYEGSGHHQPIANMYALALRAAQRPMDSLKVLRQTVSEHPKITAFRVALASQSTQVQQYAEAIELFATLLEPDINAVETRANVQQASLRMQIGQSQLYLGNHQKSIRLLEEANKLLPNSIGILIPLGEAYLKDGQRPRAKETLSLAMELNSEVPATLYWLGVIDEQQQGDRAEKYYRQALETAEEQIAISPENGSDHYLLYQICHKLELTKKADAYRQKAADLHFTYEAPWKTAARTN